MVWKFRKQSKNGSYTKNFKVGDKCYITKNVKVALGLPDGVEYTIKRYFHKKMRISNCFKCRGIGQGLGSVFSVAERIDSGGIITANGKGIAVSSGNQRE